MAMRWDLGSVDGLDKDEAQGESDDGGDATSGFLAAQGYAFEALELSEALPDTGAAPAALF